MLYLVKIFSSIPVNTKTAGYIVKQSKLPAHDKLNNSQV